MELDLKIENAVKSIKANKAKRVCVQLPDGLKPRALEIQEIIEKETNAEVIFWADSCFGACDVPELPENLEFDLLIQFGHNEYKK